MLTLFWKTNTKQSRILVRLTCYSYSGISGLKRNDGVKIPLQYTPCHRKLYVMHRTVSFVVDISSEYLCLSSGPGNYFQCRLMESHGCSLLQRYDKNISQLTPSGLFYLLKAFSTGHISTLFP